MAQVIDAVNKYKLWDSSMRRNPQAVYAQMREHDPVYPATGPVSGNRFWFFTRYHDVQAVLKDSRFGKDIRNLPPEIGQKYRPAEPDPVFEVIDRHMLNLDPPGTARRVGPDRPVLGVPELRARDDDAHHAPIRA